jgi:outer membrane receptor protein involved in Fe transport
MAYVSYARGYKAGGYNLDRAQTGITPDNDLWFPAETADSGEIGLKSTLAGGALNLNVAYFDQKYKNFQLNTFSGVAFVVESIPTLTSKGIDADMYWRTPIPGVSFQGGITYSDTKYGQFGAGDLLNPAHFAFLSSLPGQQMSFAPKWSSSGAVSWQHTFGSMRAFGNITAKYMSKYNTGSDLFVEKEQEAYTLVNARFGIGPADRAWTVEVWGQNLTDETYRQVVINAPLQGTTEATNTYDAFLGAPKTYGVTLRLHY